MSNARFGEQRARHFERARRTGVPDSVAQLFATVQEPRCDGEPSTPAFDDARQHEGAHLRERISSPSSGSSMSLSGGFGGLLETEATMSARRLLAAAEADDLVKAAELLRSALQRCGSIPLQRTVGIEPSLFPEHVRIADPETGRPIGMWR
jgi:hypothetical protein